MKRYSYVTIAAAAIFSVSCNVDGVKLAGDQDQASSEVNGASDQNPNQELLGIYSKDESVQIVEDGIMDQIDEVFDYVAEKGGEEPGPTPEDVDPENCEQLEDGSLVIRRSFHFEKKIEIAGYEHSELFHRDAERTISGAKEGLLDCEIAKSSLPSKFKDFDGVTILHKASTKFEKSTKGPTRDGGDFEVGANFLASSELKIVFGVTQEEGSYAVQRTISGGAQLNSKRDFMDDARDKELQVNKVISAESPLVVTAVHAEADNKLQEVTIESGTIVSEVKEKGKLEVRFADVSMSPNDGCILLTSGKIEGFLTKEGESEAAKSFEIVQKDDALVMKFVADGETRVLTQKNCNLSSKGLMVPPGLGKGVSPVAFPPIPDMGQGLAPKPSTSGKQVQKSKQSKPTR